MRTQNLIKPETGVGRYIDPLTDFGFKHLLGREPSKDLLMAFLNELFSGRKVITDLTYNKNEYPGPRSKSRKTIFDLTCTGQDGEQFIIEVQRIHQPYFRDRAVYYTSRLIHDQTPQGGKWDYSLKEVYFIGLMDSFLDGSHPKKYLHRVHLAYEGSGKTFYKKLGFIFIEIPKFAKTEKELKTGMDKWLFVLKNLSRLQKIPVILNTKIFSKLFTIAAVSNLNKEEYMKYEKDLMASWDEYAFKKARQEEKKAQQEEKKAFIAEKKAFIAEKKAFIAKKKAFIAEGLEEGMEKGIETGKTEVVKNLLAAGGFTIAQIANFASVSESFVRKVKRG